MARDDRAPSARDDRGQHNAVQLPGLRIDHYNLRLRDPDGEGFVGDRASQTAFRTLLDTARRDHLSGEDPFGKTPSSELGKQKVDLVLVGGDPDAAHAVHLAVEEYARRLRYVVQVFLAQPQWTGVERIVLGGGFPEHETGGLALRRAMRLLELADTSATLHPLRHDADEGGLLGWAPLLPDEARGHQAFLAVDVGGTNLRCGIVEHGLHKDDTGGKARVVESLKWRHADDGPSREDAVVRLAAMLNALAAFAATLGLRLAPFVGIACPGQVEADGSLSAGAQNLPGDWERPFHLPDALSTLLHPVDGRIPRVVMHNDAVVQGLSELRRMRKARRWAVLTIGTGLGNASYTMG
ncbi:ROK family protein [Luteimonas kalidii]|uniref:ROK family protein n=1 Tax=Luteimonas kalidii TaxID=3042025 RepID=A0ABT6JS05_9GAMM|nr:ROK family protein [Luteimonas kalidii]MDH5833469.1 ROK family protein [Luteimonas kalidii]